MRTIIVSCIAVFLAVSISQAQSVPVKTVPVAEGDQFLLFPSERLAMGGASIALDDRLLDPFVNPAKAVNGGGLQFVSTPSYYGFLGGGTAGEGSGRTIPIGAVAHRDGFFGGAMVAYQELLPQGGGMPIVDFIMNSTVERGESTISQNNVYLVGLGGAEIPGTGWSVGASVFSARLNGLEGVRRMYNASEIHQEGGMQQYRLGFYRKWERGDAAEVVLMHHRFRMDHHIKSGWWQAVERDEYDETRSFGLKAGYKFPLQSGWTVGGLIVGDWKWHPKIPNYDLMQIPRDPGDSFAYNLGVGLSRSQGRATFAVDFIYEPIWSHTWANAAQNTTGAGGSIVPAGAKTVDNHFVFSNARIRMGVHQVGENVDFSLGLDVHRISYELEQEDFVLARRRLMDQSWTEWTVSTGFGKDLSGMRFQYMGRLTLGTGRPGVDDVGVRDAQNFSPGAGDWVVAPNGPLTLQEALAFSHQLTLIVPLAE